MLNTSQELDLLKTGYIKQVLKLQASFFLHSIYVCI